jgi:putative NADH-flavin reductase
MNITIFGASGAIGSLLVIQALKEGHVVKAYIRNPSKFSIEHKNLTVIAGELNDYEKIKSSITGAECVISTLGPPVARSVKGFPVLEGHKNMIRAMESENVKRFITIATPSVKFEKDVPSIATKLPAFMAKLLLPMAYKEIVQIGKLVATSTLDWTIVRFINPTNSPASGNINVTFGDKKIKLAISRADIADFILKQTTDKQHIHSMPIIGSSLY